MRVVRRVLVCGVLDWRPGGFSGLWCALCALCAVCPCVAFWGFCVLKVESFGDEGSDTDEVPVRLTMRRYAPRTYIDTLLQDDIETDRPWGDPPTMPSTRSRRSVSTSVIHGLEGHTQK